RDLRTRSPPQCGSALPPDSCRLVERPQSRTTARSERSCSWLTMTRIDAHQHFWSLARGDYAWLTPKLAAIYRDFGPDDLLPHLTAQGIAASILVQAAPTEAETAYLLDIAAKTDFVAGVVGWTDFSARNADAAITRLAADPLLVGLRPMVQDLADDNWLLRA